LPGGERLLVAADREWIERIDSTVVTVFGIAFIAALLLGLLGAVILGGYLQRRLNSISRAAEAIIGGDTRRRMPVSPRDDEFDQLAATLNRMLDRIEGLLENLRQVSSDVAHDLRTPLARLRARLERGALDGSNAAAVIEDATLQVDNVLALFAAILRVAEVESGETQRYFERVNISDVVTELAESFAPSIEDEGRTLLWSIVADLTVEGDRELLAQAMINLIENAQRHTPRGTVIRFTLASAGERILIQVADNGPGVPRSDLDRVTRRFARLESSRNRAGHGLGLSLVTAVAKLHGGRLVLKRTDPGLSATIDLPAANAGTEPTDTKTKETVE
jgi:signal transduction histidine kinase